MSAIPPVAPPPTAQQPIPNYLAWAIISTVLATCLCCPVGLLGIVAIVYASKVNSALAVGDLDGARRASANAKTWCWVATALAIIGLVLNIVWFAVGGAQSYMEMVQQLQS